MRCNLTKALFLAINHSNWPITEKKIPQKKIFYAKMMCMPFGPPI